MTFGIYIIFAYDLDLLSWPLTFSVTFASHKYSWHSLDHINKYFWHIYRSILLHDSLRFKCVLIQFDLQWPLLLDDLYCEGHVSSYDVNICAVECFAQFKWSKSVIGKKLAVVWAFEYDIVCAWHSMTLNDLGQKRPDCWDFENISRHTLRPYRNEKVWSPIPPIFFD